MARTVALPNTLPAPVTIPWRESIPWLVFVGVLMLFLLYIVGAEQGALSLVSGSYVHEWVHDVRHLLGFPCH